MSATSRIKKLLPWTSLNLTDDDSIEAAAYSLVEHAHYQALADAGEGDQGMWQDIATAAAEATDTDELAGVCWHRLKELLPAGVWMEPNWTGDGVTWFVTTARTKDWPSLIGDILMAAEQVFDLEFPAHLAAVGGTA